MASKLIYNRRNKLNPKGEGTIDIEIYLEASVRKFRSTGVKVEPSFWDSKKKVIRNNHPEADLLNKTILIKKKQIDDFILKTTLNNEIPDINVFETRLNTNTPSFFTFFEYINKTVNKELSNGTNMIYRRTLKYLKEYSKDRPIDEINLKYLEQFNEFLIDKKKLKRNTRATLVKKIKKVLNEAFKNEYLTYSQNPFNKGFNVREEEVEARSLTLDQLKTLEGLDMGLRPELEKTRDMFLFSCYTSIRFGDLVSLSYENFHILPNGQIRLSYIPSKTRSANGKKIEFIISDFWNGKIDDLIKKYFALNDHLKGFKKEDRLFFKYVNGFFNAQLKELQRYAGISEKLHAHLARHTCITLLINDFGLDITKAQMIAGHSKIDQTRKYLRVTERDLSEAAQKVDWSI